MPLAAKEDVDDGVAATGSAGSANADGSEDPEGELIVIVIIVIVVRGAAGVDAVLTRSRMSPRMTPPNRPLAAATLAATDAVGHNKQRWIEVRAWRVG
jgi:hypothetical protein